MAQGGAVPGVALARALWAATRRQAAAEWAGSPPHLLLLARPTARAFAAAPKDFRPADASSGARLLARRFEFAGLGLTVEPGSDPWNRATPDRRFAVALHRFGWLRDLIAAGPPGEAEALRLVLEWRRVFGRWNSFSWSGEVIERRVLAFACALPGLARAASEAETAGLAADLARQGRRLQELLRAAPWRTAERATVLAIAGAALGGPAGPKLRAAGLAALSQALPQAVGSDGLHASRSPEAGLELLFDLRTLDDALQQLGLPAPAEVGRAIDRLSRGLRFLTLPDGTLPAFQGGARRPAQDLAAALAHEEAAGPPATPRPLGGYHRIEARGIALIADGAAPAAAPFAATACAQPLAVAIACGGETLVVNCGWSPEAADPALRLTDAGSTAGISDASAGAPVAGFAAQAEGAMLAGGPREVSGRRHDSAQGVWLDLAHDGWVASFGLQHERRLFLDSHAGELRGEDAFTPAGAAPSPGRRYIPFAVRFHLPEGVKAAIAQDQKSVLISAPSGAGWWLRNDALEASVEPSVQMAAGAARRSTQVVLKGRVRADLGGRVRWKLAPVHP